MFSPRDGAMISDIDWQWNKLNPVKSIEILIEIDIRRIDSLSG